jgi:outer membrane protein assembly factor BamB
VGTTNGGDVWSARAIADLDGDGHQDVVAGSFDYHVYALDGETGGVLWAYDTGNRVFSVYPVGDLDGDGRPEVVAGTQDTHSNVVVYVLDGDGGVLFEDGFESGDTTAWSSTVTPRLPGYSSDPAAAGAADGTADCRGAQPPSSPSRV